MTDTDIRDALDRATRHLNTAPDLLDKVRAGGRRRVVRRRSVLGAGLAAALAGSTAGALRLGRDEPPPELLGTWLLDEPTRGDLADDEEFLRGARAAWRRYHQAAEFAPQVLGEAHVVWAGSTPAGPAAFLAQAEKVEGVQPLQLYVGFVESIAGGLRVVDPAITVTPTAQEQVIPAALLGGSLDVLVVIDCEVPMRYSTEPRYAADGRLDRTFQPVRFSDGAAVLRVPPQGDRISIALRLDPDLTDTNVDLLNVDRVKALTGVEQSEVDHINQRALPGAEVAWSADPATAQHELSRWRDEALRPYFDVGGFGKTSTMPMWWIRGATPDGRRLWVETLTVWNDPARVVAVLGRPGAEPRVVYGGVMAKTSPVQVALRLPDKQGVVVAAKDARMRYRTGGGSWQAVSADAALLPDATTEVEVTPRGGRATRVSVR